jgi:C_GCAxxG_C_C family probable redox protein
MKGKLALEDIKQEVASIAGEYFRKGLNCAESVYQALQKVGLVDFPPDTVAMTTAFGGGIGLSGGVCGALVALTMAVSAVHGRKYPWAEENLDVIDQLYGDSGLYRFFNQIPTAFVQRFGSTDCRQLTQDYGEWFHRERYLKCRAIVMKSAIIAVDFIILGPKEGYGQPSGENMAGKSTAK